MISNAVAAGTRLSKSSTFWASVLFPSLKVLSSHFLGIDIPWEVVLAGIGAQGVRNAAEHVSNGLQLAASHARAGQAALGSTLVSVASSVLAGREQPEQLHAEVTP